MVGAAKKNHFLINWKDKVFTKDQFKLRFENRLPSLENG